MRTQEAEARGEAPAIAHPQPYCHTTNHLTVGLPTPRRRYGHTGGQHVQA